MGETRELIEQATLASNVLFNIHQMLTNGQALSGREITAIKDAQLGLDNARISARRQDDCSGPMAWESKTPVYTKYITHARYLKLKASFRRWYKPYLCSKCSTGEPCLRALEAEGREG